MKYEIKRTSQFKKDYKKIAKRGMKMADLNKVINQLAEGKELPPQNRDHALTGNYIGFRECHIAPDWLLIYLITDETLVLTLTRTGSHSDLF
ncbi:MAG: type II toxin-antitoxin system YafQ family toxin [Victivallales bacterium]|jgi:mRNA interferase YafQ